MNIVADAAHEAGSPFPVERFELVKQGFQLAPVSPLSSGMAACRLPPAACRRDG
jgi:hypothetical protein